VIGKEEDACDLVRNRRKWRARAYLRDFNYPLFGVKIGDIKGEEARNFQSYGDFGQTYAEVRIATRAVQNKGKQLRWRLGVRHGDDPLTQ